MFIPSWVLVVLFVSAAVLMASQYNKSIRDEIRAYGLDLSVLCGVGVGLVLVWKAYEGNPTARTIAGGLLVLAYLVHVLRHWPVLLSVVVGFSIALACASIFVPEGGWFALTFLWGGTLLAGACLLLLERLGFFRSGERQATAEAEPRQAR